MTVPPTMHGFLGAHGGRAHRRPGCIVGNGRSIGPPMLVATLHDRHVSAYNSVVFDPTAKPLSP